MQHFLSCLVEKPITLSLRNTIFPYLNAKPQYSI